MANSGSSSVITLNFSPIATRWVLLVPALLALTGAWFAARWYVGNTVAEYAPPADEGGIEMARMAVRWAPDDPLAHWRLASLEEKNFSAESMARAVHEYELAVQAAPYDYRYWMSLGRAWEAAGDTDKAERALRQAVALAPAYSHPRWFYGNLLVREGKIDEAFAQLSLAAEADELIRPQVFVLAMQVFNSDVEKVASILPSPALRMHFAISLITSNKIDDAARVLQAIGPEDRKAQRELTAELFKSFMRQKRFRAALAILRELEPEAQTVNVEQIYNGGFESPVPLQDQKPFHWLIGSTPQAQTAIDTRAHTGNGSLRIIFKVTSKLNSIPVSQTLIVEPDSQYRIQFFQRSDNLLSGATPAISVTDAVDNSLLATSQPAPAGTKEWQLVTLDFKTKPDHDGISIGVRRDACADNEPICPIFGTIWYDDFNLQRIGGPGASRRSAGSSTR